MADTAFFMGLIDSQQHAIVLAQQLEVVQLVHAGLLTCAWVNLVSARLVDCAMFPCCRRAQHPPR